MQVKTTAGAPALPAASSREPPDSEADRRCFVLSVDSQCRSRPLGSRFARPSPARRSEAIVSWDLRLWVLVAPEPAHDVHRRDDAGEGARLRGDEQPMNVLARHNRRGLCDRRVF